ncbi:DUF1707 domain-containing protein [Patulibacter brassicae]|uniref:DUF1707 domain-containing protein n=1 Tax=Patulibacter brassicae TaxID=1705717 RepID=A0ABU4VHE1_9ACTN|nr:DUF1707 domain-containing protein [Patulibacter brassicae]MDX8151224.1 DUF1707 domain-containing protein [Patulibacter brassicae]
MSAPSPEPDDDAAPSLPAPRDADAPALRASDLERERCAELLREATGEGRLTLEELDERLTAAFAARHRVELERLVADVLVPRGPDAAHPLDAPPSTHSPLPVRPGYGIDHQRVWAVMGGSERSGRWRVPRRLGMVNVMGGGTLDLTEAELSSNIVEITVVSIMGGADILIPEGVNLEVAETSVMGGNEVHPPGVAAPAGAPTIRLRLVSIMGGNEVRRRRERSRERRRQLGA